MFPFMGQAAKQTSPNPMDNRCHCSCHIGPWAERPRPVTARMCEPCADEHFLAWDAILKDIHL